MSEPDPIPVQVVRNGPLPSVVEPWVNLFHQIGLPWAIIVGMAYFVYPTASKSLEALNELNAHSKILMPGIKRALEKNTKLLERLNNHGDLEKLKASVTIRETPPDELQK